MRHNTILSTFTTHYISGRFIFISIFLVLIINSLIASGGINDIITAVDGDEEDATPVVEGPKYDTTHPGALPPEYYKEVDVAKLISVNPLNSEKYRKQAIRIIFGSENLPKDMPDSILAISDKKWSMVENLEKLERFLIIQKFNINSEGYIFHPIKSNNNLILYHQGHGGDFTKSYAAIRRFVQEGYTVYAFCMPLYGKNRPPGKVDIPGLGSLKFYRSHDNLKFLEYPLQYFIRPVITMVNYAEKKRFNTIIMAGFSGGGWTTTLCAGIDPRIMYSFPVAGTIPLYIRFTESPKDLGDFEQMYPELFTRVNYLDFYILGSIGKGRRHIQILNAKDACCFQGEKAKHYEPHVIEAVGKFKHGRYKLVLDTTHNKHLLSTFTINTIVDEMRFLPGNKPITQGNK